MTTISKGAAAALYLAQNEYAKSPFRLHLCKEFTKAVQLLRKSKSLLSTTRSPACSFNFFTHLGNFGLEGQPCGQIAFVLLVLLFFIDVYDLSIFNCNEMLDVYDNFCIPLSNFLHSKPAFFLRLHNLVHRRNALRYPL